MEEALCRPQTKWELKCGEDLRVINNYLLFKLLNDVGVVLELVSDILVLLQQALHLGLVHARVLR